MGINDLPYRHAAGDGGPRDITQMVVIHATDNTASDENESSYAMHRPDQTSAHFYVDDDSAFRCLPLANIAFGCYPVGNGRSVQFELCGVSSHISDATMRQAAPLVAEVCKAYGIPIRKIGPSDLVNGVKGICGHGDVTNAWHQGDHTDPGSGFDWNRFISLVQAAAGVSPTPTPAPSAPPFPLSYPPNCYGDVNGPDWMHGGYFQSERPAVKAIQQALIRKGAVSGVSNPDSGWADGVFESPTTVAVKNYQRAHGLEIDGLVGPQTWRSLFS